MLTTLGGAELTFWLNTALPTNASPTNGRTTVGGGAYEAGVAITAAQISMAANGDIQVNVAIVFGDR